MSIFSQQDKTYNINDLGFDKLLRRELYAAQETYSQLTPEMIHSLTSGMAAKNILAGELISSINQQVGVLYSGKTTFDNTVSGYRLGIDSSDGLVKFYIGDSTTYLNWTGSALNIVGSLTVTSGTIGGFDIGSDYIRDAGNSFGLASTITGGDDVRFWAGDTYANRATADFRVTEAGALTATSATITGALTTSSGSTINGTYVDSLNVSKLAAGTISSKAITLAIAAGTGDTYIAAGKTDFNNAASGFILGLDDSDSDLAKFYIGSTTTYLNWTGSALDVVGGTITGATIQTASSGLRTVMTSSNGITFYNGVTQKGIIKSDTGLSLVIESSDNIYFRKTGYEFGRFVDSGLQIANTTAFRWANGREIKDNSSWVSINGTFSSNGNETDDLGGSATKWRSVYANKYYQQASTGGDAQVFDFGFVEMGLLPKKMIKKHLGGIDGNGLRSIDNIPDESIKLPFSLGTVLCWYNGKLQECKKYMDKRVIAVSNNRGLPIVLGAEPVKVIGKVKQGDFIVSSKVKGYGMAEKNPKIGTIIGKAIQSKNTKGKGLIKIMIKSL